MPRTPIISALLAVSALLAAAGFAAAAAPDRKFGGNGRATTAFGKDALLQDVATTRRGGVVAVGTVNPRFRDCSFGLAAYRRDGRRDRSFGTRGKLRIGFGTDPAECARATDVVVGPDGRIVVAGLVHPPTESGPPQVSLAMARVLPDGTPDRSFSGDGLVLVPGLECCAGLALQPDGGIVAGVGDSDPGRISIARLEPDGSLDSGFGNGGLAEGPQLDAESYAVDVATRDDGRIVVAGGSTDGNNCGTDEDSPCSPKFALAQFLADGSVDESFGIGGGVTTGVGFGRPGQNEAQASSLAIQPDGRIVVGGDAWVHGCGYHGCDGSRPDIDFAVARYTEDGRLDRSFGRRGTVLTDVERGGLADRAASVLVARSGRIVLVGESGRPDIRFTMVGYRRNGRLDSSFSGDGIATKRPAGFATAATLVGKRRIVVGGEVTPRRSDTVFALGSYRMPR